MLETNRKITSRRYQELAEEASQEISEGRADELSTRLVFNLLRMGNRLSKDFESPFGSVPA
jgi:hypothetical protein